MRTTIGLMMLSALAMGLSALALRLEMAAPGQSAALLAGGWNAPSVATLLFAVHGTSGLMLMALAGAAMGGVAATANGPAGWTSAALGLAAAVVLAIVGVLQALPPGLQPFTMVPLDALPAERLAAALGDPERLSALGRGEWAQIAALTPLLLGAGALAGARPGHRWGGRVVQVLSVAALVTLGMQTPAVPMSSAIGILVLPLLALIATLSMQLADDAVPAAPYLWTGSVGMVLGLIVAATLGTNPGTDPGTAPGGGAAAAATVNAMAGTTLLPGLMHLTVWGFALFAVFAALNRRWSPRLQEGILWGHALGLAVLCALAAAPLVRNGLDGMPVRRLDPAASFAAAQRDAAVWALLLLGWILAGVIVAWRRRSRP
ncbi:hypothetical protein [Roseisalinus antarcticus]|uniref:Uncharacterized protein n=1 Tax=Roseisalinus antarcticus TaxID=254357 RepID=A0A1Y5RC13_9RHOB|nr:hypothetical protein [Roseisalinus antarcticus]SLN13909.1 hypothetical protein ROA7023_00092 [Roseisalinus antarcticus]